MSDILTVSEAAEKIGVSRQRILQWITDGRLEAVEVGFQWGIPIAECVRPPDMRRKEWQAIKSFST